MASAASQLWHRALDFVPWVAQAVAIVVFALALSQPIVVTCLLTTVTSVHAFAATWLCIFLRPRWLGPPRQVDREAPPEEAAPGISIIKPLAGVNDTLEENLESCFQLAYPRFELLFCVHTPDDSAVLVAKRLMERYPDVDAQLLFGEAELEGASPKVRNVAKGYDRAKYDLFWAMDSKIRTCAGDAHAMVARLQSPVVGLVHQLPWTRAGGDVSGTLERMFFAGAHARSYCLINGIGLPCTNGMSLMCKRSSWAAIGGCEALAATVAEDSLVGILMQAKGYKCRMAAVPCVQNAPPTPVSGLVERRARWYQLRLFEMDGGRWVAPFEFWLEHAALLCLSAAKLWECTGSPPATLAGAAGVLGTCALLDAAYACRIDAATCASTGATSCGVGALVKYPMAWLVNLFVLPVAVMCRGLSSSTIVWNCNGTLKPMHPTPYSSKPREQTVSEVMGWGKSRGKSSTTAKCAPSS